MRTYYVYILSSPSRALYVGITNDIARRLAEHRAGDPPGYASEHGCTRLVHLESTNDVMAAIRREKQIKAWTRLKRIKLIEESNPLWRELAPSPRSG